MGLTVKEVETGEVSSAGSAVETALNHAEFMQAFRSAAQIATAEAVERAMKYADSVSTDVITRVKAEISGIAKIKTPILSVEVNGETRKLSKPAPSVLGRLIVNAKLGLNTMLSGPAGCGKTTAAELLAESLGVQFGHMCGTAGASETWLFGRHTPNGYMSAPFCDLYGQGGVFLLDEMDAVDANFLLAINNAIDGQKLANPMTGQTIQRHEKFVFVGGCNTLGRGADDRYTARNRLDASTLSRFVVLEMDYQPEVERQLCPDDALREKLLAARENLQKIKSREILSSRAMKQAYLQKQAGIDMADIMESIMAGWSEETRASSGLVAKGKGKKSGNESEHVPF